MSKYNHYLQRQLPSYPLAVVKSKIKDGKVRINENARKCALRDFQWGTDEIIQAIGHLTTKDFLKSDPSLYVANTMLDFYSATILGELVFTHFYINQDGDLVINSCHCQTE